MHLSERRLKQSILKKQILNELNFLLNEWSPLDDFYVRMPPEDPNSPTEVAKRFCEKNPNDPNCQPSIFYNAAKFILYDNWVEFYKAFKGANYESIKKMFEMMGKDAVWVLKNDPVAAVTYVLDIMSIADPSGIADLTQGVILLSQGQKIGLLPLIFGAIQIASNIAAAETGVGIIGAVGVKVTIVGLKAMIRSGKIMDTLRLLANSNVKKVITRLEKSNSPQFRSAGQSLNTAHKKAEQIIQSGRNISDGQDGIRQLEEIVGDSISKYDAAGANRYQNIINNMKSGQPISTGMRVMQVGTAIASTAALTTSDVLAKQKEDERKTRAYNSIKNWCKERANIEFCNKFAVINKEKITIEIPEFNISGPSSVFDEKIKSSLVFRKLEQKNYNKTAEEIVNEIKEGLEQWQQVAQNFYDEFYKTQVEYPDPRERDNQRYLSSQSVGKASYPLQASRPFDKIEKDEIPPARDRTADKIPTTRRAVLRKRVKQSDKKEK